jgi:hypothetical protein
VNTVYKDFISKLGEYVDLTAIGDI